MRVLLLSPRSPSIDSLRSTLRESGYAVDLVNRWTGHLALVPYDAIILRNAALIASVREHRPDVPVVVIAGAPSHERIAHLDAGASASLGEPLDALELVAWLRALIRRKYGAATPHVRIGSVDIDLVRRIVTVKRRVVALSASEFQVLEYLVLRRGEVISLQEIVAHVYEADAAPRSRVVPVVVRALRRKLGATLIRTLHGHGYVADGT